MFSYIYKSQRHSDTDLNYMKNLGMDEEQINSVLSQRQYEAVDGAVAKRKEAYLTESDPLFIEASFDNDEAKVQAWRDKVIEIKARYPINHEFMVNK
jgi:hypothetical protein